MLSPRLFGALGSLFFLSLSASADSYYGVFHSTGTTKTAMGSLVAGSGTGTVYNFAGDGSSTPSSTRSFSSQKIEIVNGVPAPGPGVGSLTRTDISLADLFKSITGSYYNPARLSTGNQAIVGDVGGFQNVPTGSFSITMVHTGNHNVYTLTWNPN